MEETNIFLTGDKEEDTARLTYFIFIGSISLLAFGVAVLYYLIPDPEIKQVLFILDTIYAILFLIDFILRYRAVDDKKRDMLSWGWLALVTSIPGLPALRIVRSLLVLRNLREMKRVTPAELEAQARDRIAESVLYITIVIGLIVITIGSILVVWVEADTPGAEITSGSDAMWWSLVTISTVGYGDEYPVTAEGRIIGVFMILVGVALFTTLTSYLASNFTDRGAKKQREQQLELAQKNAQQMEALLERVLSLEEKIAEKTENDQDNASRTTQRDSNSI
jgi:voltage-gated potassium channel Kch